MKNYSSKTVIVPWDFSENSKAALKATLDLVEEHDKIEVVHVTPHLSAMEPGVVWGTITEDTVISNLDKSFRKNAEESGFPELKFTSVFGDPGSRIADIATERDASLIVISSHGRTGLNRMLLGSVAERVVRLAPCPVLVLRGKNEN